MEQMKFIRLLMPIVFLIVGCSSGDETDEKINPILLPTLTTKDVTDINERSAISGGEILDDGGGTIISKGVCWALNQNPTIIDNMIDEGIGNSPFSSSIEELRPNTQYYIRAYATNEKGTAYGNEVEFKTNHLIYDGNLILKSQNEIDEFGALSYTRINGHLSIGEFQVQSDISSLTSLGDLSEIEGVLRIEGNHDFENLSGLQNLRRLGALYIRDTKISNLDELINLTELSGEIGDGNWVSFIGNNINLKNIDGLKNIERIAGWLDINYNPSLENINGLSSLKFTPNLTLNKNDKITNLDALENLNSSLNILEVESNQSLEDIEGLKNVASIGFRLRFDDNPVLKDFCALSSLASNEDDFQFIISNNLHNPTREDIKNGDCALE